MKERHVILVVDDEHLVMEALVSAIESADTYEVIGATSFDAATAYLTAMGSVDVLVTDFRLWGARSGLELCEIAVALNPSIGIVLISAEHPDEVELQPRRAVFMRKPFGMSDLLRTIETAMSKVREE